MPCMERSNCKPRSIASFLQILLRDTPDVIVQQEVFELSINPPSPPLPTTKLLHVSQHEDDEVVNPFHDVCQHGDDEVVSPFLVAVIKWGIPL